MPARRLGRPRLLDQGWQEEAGGTPHAARPGLCARQADLAVLTSVLQALPGEGQEDAAPAGLAQPEPIPSLQVRRALELCSRAACAPARPFSACARAGAGGGRAPAAGRALQRAGPRDRECAAGARPAPARRVPHAAAPANAACPRAHGGPLPAACLLLCQPGRSTAARQPLASSHCNAAGSKPLEGRPAPGSPAAPQTMEGCAQARLAGQGLPQLRPAARLAGSSRVCFTQPLQWRLGKRDASSRGSVQVACPSIGGVDRQASAGVCAR